MLLVGCSSISKSKNSQIFNELNKCLVETNSSNRELPFDLDTAIVFYKSEIGLNTNVSASKKELLLLLEQKPEINDKVYSHKESEILKVSTFAAIPFCLDKIDKEVCRESSLSKCDYLKNVNIYLSTSTKENEDKLLKNLVLSYKGEKIIEKEIEYMLLAIFYLQSSAME